MSSVIISGDVSGTVTLQAPSAAGSTVVTLPSTSMNMGNGGGSVATNTAFGASALAANTTGAQETAFGYLALSSKTSGDNNSAFGAQALKKATTATESTAIGTEALRETTTGSFNTAVGSASLILNTTGANNAALGYWSLFNNTTGSANTSIGYQSLVNNTTASRNTAVGYQTLYTNIVGTYNCAFGYQAGYSATGNGGTFIGDTAGYSVTTGTWNTFIGQNAGYNVTTGGKNTIIGNYSGNQGGLDIRTGNNFVVLSDGDGNLAYVNAGNGSNFFGSSPVSYTTNAVIVPTYDGFARPAMRTYDTNSSGTAYTAWSIYRNGTSVGQVYTTLSTTTFATSSDYRLKDISGPMVGALERNAQLQPKVGTWKVDGSDFEGFVAHELQEVFPQAAHGTKDEVDADGNPVYQGVGTGPLDAHFAACINELKALIEAQAAEIATLKGQA